MSSPLSLLVPMNVAALCVSKQDLASGLKFGRIADQFQDLATKPYLGSSVVPKPFEEEALPAGVHLHWALPDALTHGEPGDGRGFRQAPNRFMVVRLAAVMPSHGAAPVELEKRAWVVESDYLWKEDEEDARKADPRNVLSRAVPVDSSTVGLAPDHASSFAYQGRVRALDGAWSDAASIPQPRFTALGYGTEAYAAAYSNCRNVFGFFDPLFDPVAAPDGLDTKHRYLSYLVIGWYSEKSRDPVNLIKTGKVYQRILHDLRKNPDRVRGGPISALDLENEATAEAFKADYRWSYTSDDNPGSHRSHPTKRPGRSLFVGQLTALEWQPDHSYAVHSTDHVDVALGTTAVEALSALLAKTADSGNSAVVETLLNDLQFDLLHGYATAAGQANRENALHERDFLPVPAGHEAGKDWRFFAGDIRCVAALLAKLQNDPDKSTAPVSRFIWAHFAPIIKSMLLFASSKPEDTEASLASALNGTLSNALYESTRFQWVNKRPETEALISQNPTGEGRVRLNRLLLEDTYPLEIGAPQNGNGRIWLIKRADAVEHGEPALASRNAAPADETALISLELPEELAGALSTLNVSQAAYDSLAAGVAARRGQVFADWTSYLAAPDDAVRAYIDKEIAALDGLIAQLDAEKLKRDRARGHVNHLLQLPKYARVPGSKSAPAQSEYVLDSTGAPRFYQPNDPIILLSGLNPSARYGGDGDLACRLSDEITAAGSLAGVAQDKGVLVRAFCAPTEWAAIATSALPCPETIVSLCVEASLLNPWMGKFVGSSELERAQVDWITRGANGTFDGTAPSQVGYAAYAQPWIPLILQWETSFSQVQRLRAPPGQPLPRYRERWVLENFELRHFDPELTYTTGMNPTFGEDTLDGGPTLYQGTVTLAQNVAGNLTHKIGDYLTDHPVHPETDSPTVQQTKRTLEEISKRPLKLMAQSMTGFHGQLRMRNQTLQMRVVAPPPPGARHDRAIKDKYLKDFALASRVSNAVGAERDAACLEGQKHFNPLRAGVLRVRRLRVLDAFGQIRDIVDPSPKAGAIKPGDVIVATRLKTAPKAWNETGAMLPLRLAQPARLSFRYRAASAAQRDPLGGVDAQAETIDNPATTPIFGWVLFNRFDHALAVYDQDGRPLGSFNLLGPVWQETPGANRGVANPHLLEFVEHLGGKVPTDPQDPDQQAFRKLLGDLLDAIDHALDGIEPDSFREDQGLAVLIGRPLALVMADLRLDLYGTVPASGMLPGLPVIDQSRKALDAVSSDATYVEANRRSADFAKVRFPLRLGDDAKVHDGLVGYFVKGADATETYRTFYTHSGGDIGHVRRPESVGKRLSLAPADEAPATVVLLVDPRASVHASVGILPAKSITIPPLHYADALKRIDATFLVAPVLGGADGITLPVPDEVGHAWSWLTRHADEERLGEGSIALRKWTSQDIVVSPNTRAAFSAALLRMSEGWLHLYPVQKSTEPGSASTPAPPPSPYDIVVKAGTGGSLLLGPEAARLRGNRIAVAESDDGRRFIGYWNDPQDYATWNAKLGAGTWDIYLNKRYIGANADFNTRYFGPDNGPQRVSGEDEPATQIVIEVRKAGASSVFATRRAAYASGSQPLRLAVGDLVATESGEYEIRIKLAEGVMNLETAELILRKP